jgi:hypothetical protein
VTPLRNDLSATRRAILLPRRLRCYSWVHYLWTALHLSLALGYVSQVRA